MTTLETLKPAWKQILTHLANHPLFGNSRYGKEKVLAIVNGERETDYKFDYLSWEFATSFNRHAVTLNIRIDTDFHSEETVTENGDQYLSYNFHFSVSPSIGGTDTLEQDLERAQVVLDIVQFAIKLRDEFTGEFLGFWRTAEEAVEQEHNNSVLHAQGQLKILVNKNKKNMRLDAAKRLPAPEAVVGFITEYQVNDNDRSYKLKVVDGEVVMTRTK